MVYRIAPSGVKFPVGKPWLGDVVLAPQRPAGGEMITDALSQQKRFDAGGQLIVSEVSQ